MLVLVLVLVPEVGGRRVTEEVTSGYTKRLSHGLFHIQHPTSFSCSVYIS